MQAGKGVPKKGGFALREGKTSLGFRRVGKKSGGKKQVQRKRRRRAFIGQQN